MSPSTLKTWIIKMSKTSTEILKPISKSNNERKHLGNVKVKLFWSLKHLVKESDSCLLRVLKTKHCFVYRNPIHSRLYIMLGWKMAVSLMKTKQMSLLWTRLFQTLYQQRASSWIYNLIWLYSAIKKSIILEVLKRLCLHGYNTEKTHAGIPGWSMCLTSLPKPSSTANEPPIKAGQSTTETCSCSSLLG